MGLDVSHDAFSGAYSAFNRFRNGLAKATGGSYPPHDDPELDDTLWYSGDNWSPANHPGLTIFFNHSDCDGEISPEDCILVANELEMFLPAMGEIDKESPAWGHLLRAGGWEVTLRKFIAGCRAAAAANEPLEFR